MCMWILLFPVEISEVEYTFQSGPCLQNILVSEENEDPIYVDAVRRGKYELSYNFQQKGNFISTSYMKADVTDTV